MKVIKSNFKIRQRKRNIRNISSEQPSTQEEQYSVIKDSFIEEDNNISSKPYEDTVLTPKELSDLFERDSRRYSYSLEVEI